MNVFTSEVEMLRAECKEWEKVCNQHLRHINKLKKKLDEKEKEIYIQQNMEMKTALGLAFFFFNVVQTYIKNMKVK